MNKDIAQAMTYIEEEDPLGAYINKETEITSYLLSKSFSTRWISLDNQRYFFDYLLAPFFMAKYNWTPKTREFFDLRRKFLGYMGQELDAENQPSFVKKIRKFFYDEFDTPTSEVPDFFPRQYEFLSTMYASDRRDKTRLPAKLTIDRDFVWEPGDFNDRDSCFFRRDYSYSISRLVMYDEFPNIYVAKVWEEEPGHGISRAFILKDIPFPGAFIVTNGYSFSDFFYVDNILKHLFPNMLTCPTKIYSARLGSNCANRLIYFNSDSICFFHADKADMMFNSDLWDTEFSITDQSAFSFRKERYSDYGSDLSKIYLNVLLHYDLDKYYDHYHYDRFNNWYMKSGNGSVSGRNPGENYLWKGTPNTVSLEKERQFGSVKLTF